MEYSSDSNDYADGSLRSRCAMLRSSDSNEEECEHERKSTYNSKYKDYMKNYMREYRRKQKT